MQLNVISLFKKKVFIVLIWKQCLNIKSLFKKEMFIRKQRFRNEKMMDCRMEKKKEMGLIQKDASNSSAKSFWRERASKNLQND